MHIQGTDEAVARQQTVLLAFIRYSSVSPLRIGFLTRLCIRMLDRQE